jgi:hypothetical protein
MRLDVLIPSHHLALCGSSGLKFQTLPGRHLPARLHNSWYSGMLWNLLASSLFPFEVLHRHRCLFLDSGHGGHLSHGVLPSRRGDSGLIHHQVMDPALFITHITPVATGVLVSDA